jgi:hypothetical protein
MVWRAGEVLPASGDSGIGVLYSQFRAALTGDLFSKHLGPGTDVVSTEVDGASGFWIEGAPHLILYEDATGNVVEEATRLAGNVLMWEADGVTHRIETMLSLEEALRIVESLRPVG